MKKCIVIILLMLSGACYAQATKQIKKNTKIKKVIIKSDTLRRDEIMIGEPFPPPPPPPSSQSEIIANDELPFRFVEQEPQFIGGEIALAKFVDENLTYPAKALEEGIQGTVLVEFIVAKDGSLRDFRITRSVSKECDAEAIRVIRKMQKWSTGKQNGKAVNTFTSLPISFTLE